MNQKILLSVFAIILMGGGIAAQEISSWVFGSGGDTYYSEDASLSFTMGQSGLAGKLVNESSILIAGFQHMEEILSTRINHLEYDLYMEVYPNPFRDQIVLSIKGSFFGVCEYLIFDLSGKLIMNKQNVSINQGKVEINIDKPDIIPGLYTLYVRVIGHHEIKNYCMSIIKV